MNFAAKCPTTNKECAQDPCRRALCNTTSDTLICVPDYCECSHKFVDEYSRPIQCGKPIYNPLGKQMNHFVYGYFDYIVLMNTIRSCRIKFSAYLINMIY